MTSFTSLGQVHLTDDLCDPSNVPQTLPKPTDECRPRRLPPSCWNAAAPVPPVQPELSAYLSRVSCDMTEAIQNQPNKTFFFFSVSKQISWSPRHHRGHFGQAYVWTPSAPGPKFQLSAGSEGDQAEPKSWPLRLPGCSWKQRQKLPKRCHQGSKHQRNTCNNCLPHSPACMQIRGSRVHKRPISNQHFFLNIFLCCI